MLIHLRIGWNMLGDPWLLVILIVSYLFVYLSKWLFFYIAEFLGMWPIPGVRSLLDNVSWDKKIAEAQAEARRKALEEAENRRIEAKALRDDAFRHRWIERNKPWLLKQLERLLTPRTLQREGPGGHPVESYVREVYDALVAEGRRGLGMEAGPGIDGLVDRGLAAGRRRPGDRGDISDTDSDELEQPEWAKRPLDPLPSGAEEMMRMWLAKARRRRMYEIAVEDLIRIEKEKLRRSLPAPRDGGP